MSWQDLAREAAAAIGMDYSVLAATVEAETGGRNVTGDGGEALGYGQVWPYWHYDRIVEAAQMVGAGPVPARGDMAGLTAFVGGNDRLSMYLAALVVHGYWEATGGDWEAFTRRYVGPAIPDSDLERRRVIWEKYAGQDGQESAGTVLTGTWDGQALILTGVAVLAFAALLGVNKRG